MFSSENIPNNNHNTSNLPDENGKALNTKNSLGFLIDNINLDSLNEFYKKEDSSNFKKSIDKLNLKFYLETEKYLKNPIDFQKCQDQLFLILFKQISLYIEEIERLNINLKEKKIQPKTDEKLIYQQSSQKMKNTIKNLENVILLKNQNEEKLKKEIVSLNKKIAYFNQKIQLDLSKNKIIKHELIGSPINSSNNTNSEIKSNKLEKKRNLSQNSLNEIDPKLYLKEQFNEPVEVNNYNINLNLHLKNNNNTNINISEPINKILKDKRELTKSQNIPASKFEIQSPIKAYPNAVKRENLSDNNRIDTKNSKIKSSFTPSTGNKKTQIKTKGITIKTQNESVNSSNFKIDEYSNLKSPTFYIPNEVNKSNEDIMKELFNFYDEELLELNELENILYHTKFEMKSNREDNIIENDNNLFNYTKDEPFSDGEDFASVIKCKREGTNNHSFVESSDFNSPLIKPVKQSKKNIQSLSQVTIDLIGEKLDKNTMINKKSNVDKGKTIFNKNKKNPK